MCMWSFNWEAKEQVVERCVLVPCVQMTPSNCSGHAEPVREPGSCWDSMCAAPGVRVLGPA